MYMYKQKDERLMFLTLYVSEEHHQEFVKVTIFSLLYRYNIRPTASFYHFYVFYISVSWWFNSKNTMIHVSIVKLLYFILVKTHLKPTINFPKKQPIIPPSIKFISMKITCKMFKNLPIHWTLTVVCSK